MDIFVIRQISLHCLMVIRIRKLNDNQILMVYIPLKQVYESLLVENSIFNAHKCFLKINSKL